ncbi:MAG: TetR/AcrR family transcriptional regulator [Succinivibrio sp.]
MTRRTHQDSIETKKKILASAQRLFTSRGYERTSLTDIAKYAHVTRGAIYWHFESKEELLLCLLDSIDEERFGLQYLLDAASPTESDPIGKLKKWLSFMTDDDNYNFINSNMMSMLILLINSTSTAPQLRESLVKKKIEKHEIFAKALKNAQAKGQLPSTLSIDLAVEHMSTFFLGVFHQNRTTQAEIINKYYPIFIDIEFETLKMLTVDKLNKAL